MNWEGKKKEKPEEIAIQMFLQAPRLPTWSPLKKGENHT